MTGNHVEFERYYIPMYEIFKEVSEKEDDFNEIRQRLTAKQCRVLDELLTNTIDPDERWEAYQQGFNSADIATAMGQTRANVAARLRYQLRNTREEVEIEHKKNRKTLESVRDWYIFVYLSDKAGTYMQAKKYTAKKDGSHQYLYTKYRENGGTKLERQNMDKRLKISNKKKEVVRKALKVDPFEKVSFQQRINPANLARLIEENNWKVFYEKDIGETKYTEKVKSWQESKRIVNAKQARRLARKREEKEKEVEDTEQDKGE